MPLAPVNYAELIDAFEFVSYGAPYEHSAYICGDTGKIYWVSSMLDREDEIPDDLETSDRYIAVPHKKDLDLGRKLALSFVEQQLPDDYDTIAGFFRGRGAYRRFNDFLDSRGVIESWYAFEASATEEALRSWCRENNIELNDEKPAA